MVGCRLWLRYRPRRASAATGLCVSGIMPVDVGDVRSGVAFEVLVVVVVVVVVDVLLLIDSPAPRHAPRGVSQRVMAWHTHLHVCFLTPTADGAAARGNRPLA